MRAVGFIGAGRLGAALIRAIARFAPDVTLHVASRDAARCAALKGEVPQLAVGTPAEIARVAEILFLTVPPGAYAPVIEDIAPALREGAVLASVSNAVPLETIAAQVETGVVKVIPTLAQTVGRGATLVVQGPNLRADELGAVLRLLARFSVPVVIDPADDRIASNVAGSGLALVAAIAESMVATNLARARHLDQAVLDAMMAETLAAVGALIAAGHSWRDIIEATATPGGMTDAALRVLEPDFRRICEEMVAATIARQEALRSGRA